MKNKTILFCLLCVLATQTSMAATATFKSSISKIFIDDTNFGGCMIAVSPGPADAGLDCKNAFVTLDCQAAYTAKDVALRKLAAAQLAYVTDQNVSIKADDTRKHNGYCLASRVDNIKY